MGFNGALPYLVSEQVRRLLRRAQHRTVLRSGHRGRLGDRARLESSGRYRSWMCSASATSAGGCSPGKRPTPTCSRTSGKPRSIRPRPYLLSRHEIERFFTAGARRSPRSSPWQWQAVAFFTLMHSCGLRTGEARALRPSQVDLHAGHVNIVVVQRQPQPQAAPVDSARSARVLDRLRSAIG